jgi:hypothetical protein
MSGAFADGKAGIIKPAEKKTAEKPADESGRIRPHRFACSGWPGAHGRRNGLRTKLTDGAQQ